ncbi:hypothetical protein BOX15_Mlig031849g2, partial [Macrostomum lignano]
FREINKTFLMKLKAQPDYDTQRDEKEGRLRDVSDQAIWWLSSCKPGYGVQNLMSDSLATYWQSDGPQPHLVNIQFRRKTAVCSLCVYVDFKQDESYTPSKLAVKAGNHFQDLEEVESVELLEPSGWVVIDLRSGGRPRRAFILQLVVLANHQNGRDTHLRRIKVLSLAAGGGSGVGDSQQGGGASSLAIFDKIR